MTFNEVCDAVESGRSVWVPSEFVDAVRSAASRARATREIGLIQFWRINAALRNSRQLAKIYAGVVDEAVSCGVVSADADEYEFDWESILDFLERLLPLILQLISIFS